MFREGRSPSPSRRRSGSLNGHAHAHPHLHSVGSPGACTSGGACSAAWPWRGGRRRWQAAALAALLLPLLALFSARHTVHKRGLDVYTALSYRLDRDLRGRTHARHPAPACCAGVGCVRQGRGKGRVAVLTYVRDEAYFPLFQQLECTLRRSNPGLELAAMTVADELSEASLARMRALNVTLVPVNRLDVENWYEPRFARNWLKVRALELAQYDAVLLVDADVAVVGGVREVFALPAAFAAVLDQPGWLNQEKTAVDMFQGGVFFIRPCPATAQHMLRLVAAHPKLRFRRGNAEQEFFSWYFRHTGWTLPMEYNTMTHPSLRGNLTTGGAAPKILHYTSNKPFRGLVRGSPGHEFLCSAEQLAARAAAAGGGGGEAERGKGQKGGGGGRRRLRRQLADGPGG